MARRLLGLAAAALLTLTGCATVGPPAPVETRGSPTASGRTTATPTVDSRVHSPAAGAEHAAAEGQTARQTETPEMATDTSTTGALPRRERPTPANDPATLALLTDSDRAAAAARWDDAVALVERALRIRPQDPVIWLRLAELHLLRQEPAEAERLAQRGIAFAGSNPTLARYGWLLVADARTALGDDAGARRIRAQWGPWRG